MRARQHQRRQRTILGVAVLALVAAIPLVNAVRPGTARADDAIPGDGTTSVTAGASCWGIKQAFPDSPDGLYWLLTAGLDRPAEFACDMQTDGGGWVLIGRGRQGWTFAPSGQGSPASLRTVTDGPGAFSPAALDTDTINGLLNGVAMTDQPDGIRLERSLTSNGSSRQDYRLYPTRRDWTWALDAGQLLNRVVIGRSSYPGSNTADTAASVPGQSTNALSGQQGTNRLFTTAWKSHAYAKGFSFGTGVGGGSSASTSYLWTAGSEGSPIPFTRVWLRPRIANDAAGFTPIPDNGYPAQPKAPNLNNRSEFAHWGVVGLDHTDEQRVEPWRSNVLQLKVLGDTTFVGGRFTGVQNGPSAQPIAQPYLAAFDLDGNWRSNFRPTLDGRVWDMVPTPDGKLIISGDFTSVNGAPDTEGLAKVDPATGAVVPGFKATFARNSGRVRVRTLAIRDDTVYAAGSFSFFTGGTWNQIRVSSAINFNAITGTPGGWKPQLHGAAVRASVTKDGTRVLIGGYFDTVNGDTNHGYFAITDAGTGAPVPGIGPWLPSGGSNAKYQQAVADLGDGRILVGGSEHDFQLYDYNRTHLIDSTITKAGGDTQVITQVGSKIYMGCHCTQWVYSGTNNWSNPSGFRSVDPINLVGAWDAQTFQYDTSWYPNSLRGASSEGIWAVDSDSRGCVWVGGDLDRGGYSGNAAADWLGGFARFCPTDSTAPSTPSDLNAKVNGSSVDLSWGGSTDASGTIAYDVYRNDRVIASTWGMSFTDTNVTGKVRYTVRAYDATGNRSASPAPVAVNGPAQQIDAALAFGSDWRYADNGSDLGTGWRAAGFNDSGWAHGPAQLGWGVSGLGTTLGSAHPITTYFRSSFDVTDPAQVRNFNLQVRALTGAVIYVNGVETGRLNMLPGQVTATTTAAGYLTAAQEKETVSVNVPTSILHKGTNSIAVEVHNMRVNSGRQFFDLEATAYGAGDDNSPPTAAQLTATVKHPDVALSWTPSTDDVALAGYLIKRDGQPLAATSALATGFTDGEVDSDQPHTYQVLAFDRNGNTTASNTANVAATADPNLMAFGSNWKWSFTDAGPGDGWQNVGFDDSQWAAGPGELGFGDGDERTVISNTGAPRPLTAYFRTIVDITDPTAFQAILADVIRDDGAVVYVNGVEVGRDNLPAGPIAADTQAPVGLTSRKDETTPVRFTISSTAFVAGTNTIAVEVHGNSRWTGDLSFDLRLTGQP